MGCGFAGSCVHGSCKLGRLGDLIDQAPIHSLLTTHTFHAGTKQIGMVVTYFALVGHAGQATGAWQHAEQWHFWQRHC
jgi:hypothetical protein